ncbi:MAG: outer membrane protein transport protein [Kiritimatiellae bacterium]|nr:outer membrane protein transport protein [Kiritimatiellia bacterium]
MKKLLALTTAVLAASAAFASGFALYEPTAIGTSYGGALLGKGLDGSANSINPATLDDITNITVQVGFITEHPRGRIKIAKNGLMHTSKPMDPGFFVLPHFQVVAPALWGFTFGLGVTPDYGLGTRYSSGSLMTWSSKKTTIEGFVINPNVSYRITDDWSIGLGARLLYFDFEQYSFPMSYLPANNPWHGIRNHLHGNNGLSSCGWQIGTRYKILDNLSVGAVYKSKIDTRVKGHSNLSTPVGILGGAASANLDIPQSIAAGVNWDITSDWHLGAMVSWTDWSSLDTLLFKLPAAQGNKNIKLSWRDSWRVGIAPSWDFAKDWTAVVSYVYDSNVCASDQASTMLPPGDRQIVSGGLSWRLTQNLQIDATYGIVVMGCKSMHMNDPLGRKYRLECHRGLSHAAGCTLTYRF